jgi:hydrogenase nickel incorporation protein HypA/HybF
MHEPAIAAELIALVKQEVEQAGHPQAVVTQVRIRLGVMRGVVEDSLRFAFEALTVGTFLEKAELVVEKAPVLGVCRHCGADFRPQEPIFICESCGSGDLDIQGGAELDLVELTAEEADE